MNLPEIENYVAGEFSAPDGDRCAPITDSNTGEAVQEMRSASPEQLEAALACATELHESQIWARMPVGERADYLEAMAAATENDEFVKQVAYADSLSSGVCTRFTRLTATLVAANLRGAAALIRDGLLSKTLESAGGPVQWNKRPWGVAALIGPYNGPTVIGSHKIASALAAGAPAIYKPSEFTPHSAVLMAKAAHAAGLPKGALQIIQGDRSIGGGLVTDKRTATVSFTGGVPAGQAIAVAAAPMLKPLQLELGGNNPLVVFADADMDKAVDGVIFGLTTFNGQWCRGLGRVLVHQSLKAQLLERVLERLSKLSMGNSQLESTDIGPLVNQRALDLIQERISECENKGGKALTSTEFTDLGGYFLAPTLIDGCAPEDTQEEMFGPAAYVHGFESDEEALALANGTPFGLAAYVYSENIEKAKAFSAEIATGGVKINGYSLLSLHPHAPRANWGMSGLNDEGAIQTVEFFCGSRVIGVSGQD